MGSRQGNRERMTGRNLLLLCLVPSIVLAQKKPAEIPDGPRGGGTVFSKCGGVFGSSLGGNDRCYEVTVNKLQVQMGSDGTNDDVSVKICSDDKKTCCTTPALKSTFSDDWSKNDLETWGKKYFGPCKDKKFKIKNGQGRPCVPGVNCSQTKSCKKKAVPKLSIGVPRKTTARPRSKTTARRSSQRIATSTKRTTTRRPFRSGSG